MDTMAKQASGEGQTLDKEIGLLRKTIAEMKLGIGSQETIKEATSGSCQDSLVPNSLNKSLEKKDVTVENEDMVLKEFSKELQFNVENSYKKKVSIDTDSQDYIFIKTDLMFDANSLAEHQKQSLKRRKEDITALYNDLSQSSSQDTQNLQEWFDKKSKSLGEAEKDHNKKDNISIRNILDDDANKENKIEMKELEAVSKSTAENDTKSTDHVKQNISLESVQKAKDNAYSNENLLIEEDQMMTAKNACDNAEPKTSVDLMSRDLDANKQEKSLENKDDKNLSPSMLDSSKRCNLYNVAVKPATSPKFEEIVYNQPRQSNTNKILRSVLRTKLIEDKSEIIDKQKASENVENKLTKEKIRHIYMRLFAF